MKDRILDINPKANIITHEKFFTAETDIIDNSIDYIIDAIDTVKSKIELITIAKQLNIKIISSMGTGNKLEANKFEVEDISKTSVCPLAKVIRKELKKQNIENLKVVYSKEEPKKVLELEAGKRIPASISFVPSSAGLLIAGEVIKDLINI